MTLSDARRTSMKFVSRVSVNPNEFVRHDSAVAEETLDRYRTKSEDFGLEDSEFEVIDEGIASSKSGRCTICFTSFEEGERTKILPGCGHMFHVDCIRDWLRRSEFCPNCKHNVREELEEQQLIEVRD